MTARGARWAGLAAGLAGLAAAAPAHADQGTPLTYMLGYGTKAYPVVALTWGLLGISLAVILIVGVLLLWGIVARRQRSVFARFDAAPVSDGGGGLRWIGIGVAITVLALVGSLIWTVVVLADVRPPAKTPLTIVVTGHQWWWEVRYLNPDPTQVFDTANEIHIPTGEPVKVLVKGADVIHSFWAPPLTGKTETIPGKTNITWMEADQPGVYRGQCTEFCGLQHAHMALFVVAQPPAQFAAWRDNQTLAAAPPSTALTQQGASVFLVKCGSCHAVKGSDAGGTVAPDLTHLMSRKTIAAGVLPNTPAGLSGWIANPQGVKPGTKMPTLYLTAAQLGEVRAYLETLK